MDKQTCITEIFEVEGIKNRISKCPLLDYDKLLLTVSKTTYSLKEELGIGHATIAKYLKILFPDRSTTNSKLDNWLLSKYGYKQCKNCEEVFETDHFSSNSSNKDGLNSHCKDCYKETTREYQREYQKRRKALKIDRIPSWADVSKIKEIYAKCPEGMEVDHIIPLQGDKVSGLHVENNLQYLSPEDNRKKYNKFAID